MKIVFVLVSYAIFFLFFRQMDSNLKFSNNEKSSN